MVFMLLAEVAPRACLELFCCIRIASVLFWREATAAGAAVEGEAAVEDETIDVAAATPCFGVVETPLVDVVAPRDGGRFAVFVAVVGALGDRSVWWDALPLLSCDDCKRRCLPVCSHTLAESMG